nr:oligosaccharide flippase family protein [Xenorhabdus budapestensis]
MTGTTVAQAIPIAISPILTRIYTPSDFGVLALFMSIVAIIGGIINARYELAIMLPQNDEDAINLFTLGLIINTFLSLTLMLLIIIFHGKIITLLNNEEIGFWLYIIPLAVFFTGLFNLLNYFNTRIKNYKTLRNSVIIKSLISAIIQLTSGLLKFGANGLIFGQLLSNIFSNGKLLKAVFNKENIIKIISTKKILHQAKRYKIFPTYSVLAVLCNNLSLYLINLIIPSLFNLMTLGFYSLVQRVLGMPSSLIGGSIGQVFFQEAAQEKKETGQAIKSFIGTIKKLLFIGIPLFISIYLTIEDLFSIIFGEEWRIAGYYAKLICPLFFIRFIVSTVSPIDTIMEKQNIYLIFNVVLLSMNLLILYISYGNSFEYFLTSYTIGISFVYILYGFILGNMAKG